MKNTQYIVYNIAVSEITSCSMNYTIDFLLTVLQDSWTLTTNQLTKQPTNSWTILVPRITYSHRVMAGMALLGELDACAWKIKSLKKKKSKGRSKTKRIKTDCTTIQKTNRNHNVKGKYFYQLMVEKKNRGCAYCLATQWFSLHCNSRIRNRIINHRSTQYSLGKMSRPKYLVGVLYSDYRELVFCSLPLCLLLFSLSLLPHSSPHPLALSQVHQVE